MSARGDPPDLGLPLPARPPAVAGSFYPRVPDELATMVDGLLDSARSAFPMPADLARSTVAGVLVPHAGLVYSGIVAAAGWSATVPSREPVPAPTIVLLGTNHGAAWLDGVGAWDGGPWRTPLGDVAIDRGLTDAVVALGGPFVADDRCHLGEHSLEVQLPFVARLAPGARIVALSVGTGTGRRGVEAGERLGALLAARRAAGETILLAISTDMAHYPAAGVAERVTAVLLPHIQGLDPESLADAEAALTRAEPRVSCGMCGIAPAVLGLAALRAMGAHPGIPLAAATS
ncbi:MAG: AmmeMemoRadiSam system protein B, partial [Chloroflexota bacterium]